MGDDDAYDLSKCTSMQAKAMAKLLAMNNVINTDESGYYEVQVTLEESLRKKHPAVQDAYNQYQVLLKFAKAEYYATEESK